MSASDLEEGLSFCPAFDAQGLIPAIVTDYETGQVLMFAYMNEEALNQTIKTGETHFWSRSRQSLWRKGETSGDILFALELLTDCDQDVLWVRARRRGKAACHTGRVSCFYRRIIANDNGTMTARSHGATPRCSAWATAK